jgi:hypothetical protein
VADLVLVRPKAAMHQLVLQFATNSVRDYDDLVALERQLVAELGESEVDGHDMGSGEANIFILTADAQTTFRYCSAADGCQRSPLLICAQMKIGITSCGQRLPRENSVLHEHTRV